jgi:hypothetical protein
LRQLGDSLYEFHKGDLSVLFFVNTPQDLYGQRIVPHRRDLQKFLKSHKTFAVFIQNRKSLKNSIDLSRGENLTDWGPMSQIAVLLTHYKNPKFIKNIKKKFINFWWIFVCQLTGL